jgi:hypothetical protein
VTAFDRNDRVARRQRRFTGLRRKSTVSLFADCLEGYFWAYDNNGLRLLQVRFYYDEQP